METTLTDQVSSPEFAVVVRGYDRAQVDEYLGELLAWVSEAERRMLATDQANEALRREVVQLRAAAASLEERAGVPGPQSLNAFSERMGQVMSSAVAAADELRVQAEREANERRDAVAAEVERMLERAKAEAREILRRARAKERDLQESISALAERRGVAVEELGRLHHQLSELLAMPEATPATGAGAEGGPDPNGPPSTVGMSASGALPRGASDNAAAISEPSGSSGVTQALPAVTAGPNTPEPTRVQPADADGSQRRTTR